MWVRIENRCLNFLSNWSGNLRQPCLASLSELLIFSCQPRDLLSQGMLLSLQRVHIPTIPLPVAISLCLEGQVNCNCFDSFHREGSREHKKLYCEIFQHFHQREAECHQFPNAEQDRTRPGQYKCLILGCQPRSTNQPRFTNQSAPLP